MSYPEEFLDRLRRAVPISEVAGKRMKLRREGGEFRAAENHSLSINDKKGIWKDFANGEKAGDIFDFLQEFDRCTFPEAVETVARIAGLSIPSGSVGNGNGSGLHRSHGDSKSNGSQFARDGERNRRSANSFANDGGTRVALAQWDYTDDDGKPLYQTVRIQWRLPDGSWRKTKDGKAEKTFIQRRRSPDVDGTWVNSLSFTDEDGEPIQFMRRSSTSDWLRYDEKNYKKWGCTQTRTFAEFGNVSHSLLYLPEIVDELREERHEQRTIFIPEGEKKVDLLRSWGLLATCNSGGANNWHEEMARLLADAADIVILEDNDDAGRNRTGKIAPILLEHGCRVRALSMSQLWPECPAKGDVVDWAECGGGTREGLFKALERLPDWTPPPYTSQYGANLWGAHRATGAIPYEWQVKGLIPAGHAILIIGPSGSGKSFETTSMALSVARGKSYGGRKVKQCGVVYLNYEAGQGMSNRLTAYQQFHGIPADESVPFAWLTRPPGLYAAEENAVALAKEIKELTAGWSGLHRLGVIVVDTHNAATRGSSEIKTEDITKIMDRYAKVQAETGAAIWIVGHTNSNGEHRGSEVLYNGIETCILIERVKDGWGKNAAVERDDSGRILRRIKVKKQREGIDGVTWDFVLQAVEIGRDDDGDPITSMVSVVPNREGGSNSSESSYRSKIKYAPKAEERIYLKALRDAIGQDGIPPPLALDLPSSVGLVVAHDQFNTVYKSTASPIVGDEDGLAFRKKQNSVATALNSRGLIRFKKVGEVTYMWPLKTMDDEAKSSSPSSQQPLVDPATNLPMDAPDPRYG